MTQPAVVYVHPSGHFNDCAVPMGAIACMNAVRAPKRGRFAFELDDAELRRARVVAIDLHWAIALPFFERLVAHVRRVSPEALLVAGGITAGAWPRELLARTALDCVIVGDSEVAFARLVDAALGGGDVTELPNVVARDGEGPRVRMSRAELDATDTLSIDWFPSHARRSQWDTRSFLQGRGIGLARGCVLRCQACYGGFASTFGRGVLVRSPASVAALARRLELEAVRHPFLVAGKLSPATFERQLEAIAADGPLRLATPIGLYVCTLTRGHIERLAAAFASPVRIWRVPPDEHEPALPVERIAAEEADFRAAVRRLPAHISVETCAETDAGLARHRSPTERATVTCSASWPVPRPNERDPDASFEAVRAAVEPVWTLLAGRVLSPTLARLLERYGTHDGTERAPAPPEEHPAELAQAMYRSFERHRLPYVPELRFAIVPASIERGRAPEPQGAPAQLRCAGSLRWCAGRALSFAPPYAVSLAVEASHDAVTLAATVDAQAAEALAIVPRAPDGALGSAWLDALRPDGFLVVALDGPGMRGLRVELRCASVEVEARALGSGGEVRAAGAAALPWWRTAEGVLVSASGRALGGADESFERAGATVLEGARVDELAGAVARASDGALRLLFAREESGVVALRLAAADEEIVLELTRAGARAQHFLRVGAVDVSHLGRPSRPALAELRRVAPALRAELEAIARSVRPQ